MKLSALLISNFKGINEEIKILVDRIVVLIGANNSCKSTVLDAYEKYYSMGDPLTLEQFNNRDENKIVTITGVFSEITDDDVKAVGQEWLIEGGEFGKSMKFQIRWEKPNEDGEKYSFSNKTNDWKKGGAGGWDAILKNRLPTPIRVNPNDGYEALEKVVKDLVAKSAASKLKADQGKAKSILQEIEKLAKEVEVEISGDINKISKQIESEVEKLFAGTSVGFETGVGKFKAEDAIKEGSRFILTSNGTSAPLEHQGSGIKRAFLWSAINALCNEGHLKKGKTKIDAAQAKILLLDEPEINLHPAIIKAARKAIYALAEIAGWQVMCTTHSPIFIDLTQSHTTLIKVSNTPTGVFYFQTDKATFDGTEIEQLKMLNRCCPTVNEFFFYENAILVEGDTENIAFQYLLEKNGLNGKYCVINCRGKANIPTFIKIFNQFRSNAIAIHDLDSRLNVNGGANGMWTINHRIREAADLANGRVMTVVQNPDFEGFYLNQSLGKDKPYNLFKHLNAADFETNIAYKKLRNAMNDIISGQHTGIYLTSAQIESMA
ncbi:ATP-dependent endonuclease [Comamonas sp.]|uniref:ATP-dependent nuclease n=1 Tax=Comamonas sp. TaxID=34028 RepID=UPI002587493E|nr:AAA family ATPase [Comamonas sp.]